MRLDKSAFIKWLQSKPPDEAVTRPQCEWPHSGPIVAYLCETSGKKCWTYKSRYHVEGQDSKAMRPWVCKFIDNTERMSHPITAAQALIIMDTV